MTAFGIIFTTASTYKQKYSVNIGLNPVQVTLRPVQTDATLLDGTCCVRLHTLLHVVKQSLKTVNLLSTCKRTQQLPTMLRPLARGFKRCETKIRQLLRRQRQRERHFEKMNSRFSFQTLSRLF